MRNAWYLLFGPPVAFYLAILIGPMSMLVDSRALPGGEQDLACTYFTGTRLYTVQEKHFCDRLHTLVKSDRLMDD
jgi:hypothetical protein